MRNEMTEQARKVLQEARKAALVGGQHYVGTEHLLLGLLREKEGTAGRILEEAEVKEDALRELIDRLVAAGAVREGSGKPEFSPRAEKVLALAKDLAEHFQSEKTGTEHLLLALLQEYGCVGVRLLYTLGVNIQKLYAAVLTAMGFDNDDITREMQNLRGNAEQTDSSTPTLDKYSRDLTHLAAEGSIDPVVGREREISRLIQILSRRTKNNPCLVGEPGVGKTAIAEGLAQRIISGMVPGTLQNRRLLVLEMSGMVAGTKYRGEFEERIRNVIDEVREHPEVLLFIDELHTIIGAGGAEGSLDASNILKPALSRGEIQMIGATTLEEYRKYIEKDAALERRFQPVTVEEPTEEETVEILKGLRPLYENHHGLIIDDSAVNAAAAMSARYITDRFLPDKAIDLMDEASSKLRLGDYSPEKKEDSVLVRLSELEVEKENAIKTADLEKLRMIQREAGWLRERLDRAHIKGQRGRKKELHVTESSIASVVSDWTKIPVSRLTESETKKLAKLENVLHKRVVGQEEAVHAVSQAVKRGRVGLKDPNRPIGSFLFLGPTGVGKTELSKALAEAVFGDENNMIRVDMSEYMEKHSVSRMIGSPPGYVGYDEGGQLSEKVRRNPYSVILFDEIEKAHPDVFNILLQVLDDGHITDSQGRKVDFKQTIIIMTSNAGAKSIVEPKKLGFLSEKDDARDYERMKSGVMEEVKRLFRPEFLNRIDETIVFHPLGKPEIRQIVNILLKDLTERCEKQMSLALKVTGSAKDLLCEAGFDSKYGARPLRRAIQTQVEDVLAEEILSGKISRGDTVTVGQKDKKIFFSVKNEK